jgi:hypothetical protein
VMDEVDKLVDGVKIKFSSVLAYFGEEPTLQSHEFFATLTKFVQVSSFMAVSRGPYICRFDMLSEFGNV